ncbi:unnamed protein product, partial [marine sediment metagenome]
VAAAVAWNRAHPLRRKATLARHDATPKAKAAKLAGARRRSKDPANQAARRKDRLADYYKNADARRATSNAWKAANPDADSRRRARVATPAWVDHDAIRELYREARELGELTGIRHHVDHVIPLAGELVSGLHVAANLRAVPADVNRAKGNRFDPETFDGP